jgi:hypothetical protein
MHKEPFNLLQKKKSISSVSSNFGIEYMLSNLIYLFINYCAGWGNIVAFTKVLTMYQIYHT